MLPNPRHLGYTVLLVGLFLVSSLVISGVSYPSPANFAPDRTQPAPMASPPPISTVSLPTRTPEILPPALNIPTVTLAAKMPEALPPALYSDEMAFDFEDDYPVKERLIDAQPEEDRTPTRLVITAIELDAPVEMMSWHVEKRNGKPVNVWDVPDHFAAGWIKSSAPWGMPGNTVLDGHNNIKGKVFKDLTKVKIGDTIMLYAGSQERMYHVDQIMILKEAGQPLEVRQVIAKYYYPTADERLTLVTCWPPRGNSHRLIIVALPVPLSPTLSTFR